jgi:hypothetical protein
MRSKSRKITCTKRGVFMTADSRHWIGRRRVAGPIRLRSIGRRYSDGATLVEIRFKTIHGNYQSELFEYSYLQPERWKDIKIRLGDQGYRWPDDPKVSTGILKELTSVHPQPTFVLASAPGWYGEDFVLPDEVFSANDKKIDIRIDPESDGHIGVFALGDGSLTGWQETVGIPARKSSCMRVAIAAPFAAPAAP